MGDLEIIEMLLQHPKLKDQVLVSDREISGQFKSDFMMNGASAMNDMYTEIKDAIADRKTARVFDEIFIEREPQTETAN